MTTRRLRKPESVAKSKFRSKKWNEIVKGRNFEPCDAPVITALCYWYEVLEKCMEDLDDEGEIQVAYLNKMDDVKEMPQIGTMKKASAEIRALNKQLGIKDEPEPVETRPKETKLYVIQQKRQSKAANSA